MDGYVGVGQVGILCHSSSVDDHSDTMLVESFVVDNFLEDLDLV